MPRVTVLSREETARSLAPGTFELTVALTFSAAGVPPRIIVLPREGYRPADAGELRQQPRLSLVPAGSQAAAAERQAILADLATVVAGPASAWEF